MRLHPGLRGRGDPPPESIFSAVFRPYPQGLVVRKILEKLSKKYGIGISGCGVFDYWDEDGFKEIEYRKDSSSGDLRIDKLVFSDGTSIND